MPRISDLMQGKINLFSLDTHDRHGNSLDRAYQA